MAVSPTLGTGLFIGAGQALAIGGPASLLVSYIFLSLLTYFMVTTAAEVATHTPSRNGTLVTNAFRYMSPSMGVAAGFLRWYTLALFVPYETATAMVNLGLWTPGAAIAGRLALITAIIVGFNFMPERFFRTSEKLFTQIKIGTIISLLVLSLSIAIGGATGHDKWGFQYWKKPGAMREYLVKGAGAKVLGLLQCLLTSSIAFALVPELIVHRAESPQSPSESEVTEHMDSDIQSGLPRQVTLDVATTVFPYILSSLAMGLMAPYNDPLLTNNGAGAGLSPFVIGLNTAKVHIVPVMATLAIMVSSVASGRSFLFAASHALVAMSELGHGPKFFQARNRHGIRYVATTVSALPALLAFTSVAISSSAVSNYFHLFLTSSGFVSWLILATVYHHYRRQLRLRGTISAYRFDCQPYGTYFGFVASAALIMANGITGALPGPWTGTRGGRLLAAYITLPMCSSVYIFHRFRDVIPHRTWEREEDTGKDDPENVSTRSSVQETRRPDNASALEMDQVWSLAVEA
jgi:amino acid transporter